MVIYFKFKYKQFYGKLYPNTPYSIKTSHIGEAIPSTVEGFPSSKQSQSLYIFMFTTKAAKKAAKTYSPLDVYEFLSGSRPKRWIWRGGAINESAATHSPRVGYSHGFSNKSSGKTCARGTHWSVHSSGLSRLVQWIAPSGRAKFHHCPQQRAGKWNLGKRFSSPAVFRSGFN